MITEPMPSYTRVARDRRRRSTAAERDHEADQRAGVLEQDDRELGDLGACGGTATTPTSPRTWFDSLHRGAEREPLEHHRHARIDERDRGALDRLGVLDLVDALVDGEHRPEREQHDRHHEGPEVPLASVAERVLLVGGLASAALPPSRSRPWLPVSAAEWMASDSIDEAPVMSEPDRASRAQMPRLAKNAAMIAFLLPDADIDALRIAGS